jgi:hypothetical protein
MSTLRPWPFGNPASDRSCFALATSNVQVLSPSHANGISHGVKYSATVDPGGKKFLTS